MSANPLLVLLNEGTRGHIAQSRGIAARLNEITPIDVIELEVPRLKRFERFKYIKLLARKLAAASPIAAEMWMNKARGAELAEKVRAAWDGESPLLFLSAGSSAAPYCLALAKRFGGKSCVIMTPSVLGVKKFDWAIVPKHDGCSGDNVLVTLGAPNQICPQLLADQERELLRDYPPRRTEAWGVLIGGDDQNYSVAPLWVNKVMPTLLDAARLAGADLYITTSRRTQAAAEAALVKLCAGNDAVRMLLLASQDPRNPVPGILGHCSRVFCTEDSVSMISESVASGARVAIVTVGHRHGIRRFFQEITEYLVDLHLLSPRCLWGVPRFNRMIEDFENQNYLTLLSPRSLDEDLDYFLDKPTSEAVPLRESTRAAKWLAQRWLA